MRTENLAIVFIDIAGFTSRTSRQSREENERMLARFSGSVRPLTRAFGGRVVKSIGDAFLMTFRSPTDALHCSMAIQDRLTESDAQVPQQERFKVRAAVNVGEVRIERGDVFGEAVNIASRIESKAGAGEIYFSEAVYLSMTRSEIPYQEVGEHELKGISSPVRLYRVPHVDETGGYRLTVDEGTEPDPNPNHPLAPAPLPYGGLALARARERRPSLPQGLSQQLGSMSGPALGKLTKWTGRIWTAFSVRMQGSPRFRWLVIGTAAAIAITVVIVFVMWPDPEPLSPWQKLRRGAYW